jgi:hypothetical protein
MDGPSRFRKCHDRTIILRYITFDIPCFVVNRFLAPLIANSRTRTRHKSFSIEHERRVEVQPDRYFNSTCRTGFTILLSSAVEPRRIRRRRVLMVIRNAGFTFGVIGMLEPGTMDAVTQMAIGHGPVRKLSLIYKTKRPARVRS